MSVVARTRVLALAAASISALGTGCFADGPWEDRSSVAAVFSDDGMRVGATVRRWRERERVDGPSDATWETCCDSFELYLLEVDGSDRSLVLEGGPRPQWVAFRHIMRSQGYAMVGVFDEEAPRDLGTAQLWLADGRFATSEALNNAVPSPSGAHLAGIRHVDPTCGGRECARSFHIHDAITGEEVMAIPIPGWPEHNPDAELRWLDEETVLVDVSVIRVGEGIVRTLPAAQDCGNAPITTSSEISADGSEVEARLEGEEIVLDFTASSRPPWPGPCAALLDEL